MFKFPTLFWQDMRQTHYDSISVVHLAFLHCKFPYQDFLLFSVLSLKDGQLQLRCEFIVNMFLT